MFSEVTGSEAGGTHAPQQLRGAAALPYRQPPMLTAGSVIRWHCHPVLSPHPQLPHGTSLVATRASIEFLQGPQGAQ